MLPSSKSKRRLGPCPPWLRQVVVAESPLRANSSGLFFVVLSMVVHSDAPLLFTARMLNLYEVSGFRSSNSSSQFLMVV